MIKVPDFLKNDNSKNGKKKMTKSKNMCNIASYLSNTYSKLHPELGIEFYVPNGYVDTDEEDIPDERQEIIKMLLKQSGAYAIHTNKENKFKLLDAYKAYEATSHILKHNRPIKTSNARTGKYDKKPKTALDVFLYYTEKLHGRYRKVKK